MPNDFNTLSSDLIIRRALELTMASRPMLGAITTDFAPDGALLDQEVKSRIYTVPAVTAFGAAAEAITQVEVPLKLTAEKQVYHTLTRQEVNSTDRALIDEAAEPIAEALADYFVKAAALNWTGVNFTNYLEVTGTSFDYSNCNQLRSGLTTRKVPRSRRSLVLDGVSYAAALEDPTIIEALKNSGNQGAITSGRLPGVAGFDSIFEYPDLSEDTDLDGLSLTGVALRPDSTLLIVRPHKITDAIRANFPGNVQNVSIALPENNGPSTLEGGMKMLTVTVAEWTDTSFNSHLRISFLIGSGVGNANNLTRIVETGEY
jgi:hypothetical protein